MKKVLLLLGLMMALFAAPSYAQHQHGVCGVTHEQGLVIKERMLNNRKVTPNFVRTRGATSYVPVKIHLVGKDDGTGFASVDRVLDMLCVLNEGWETADIQFYLKGDINYIEHTAIYSHTGFNNTNGNVAIWNDANPYKVNDAINVFVTNNVGGSNGNGITLAYYTPLIDCVFVRKASMLGASVLPHEMGHFFSLNHPFLGWESQEWDEGMHGLQVGLYSPANTLNEKVNDPQCNSVADGICDTPPDYLFAFSDGQSGSCSPFTGGTMDPNGVVIDPLEDNMMSYFESCPNYVFTEEQMNEAVSDLNKPYRNYVNPGITPNLDVVDQLAVATFPINGEETFYNAVELRWDPVPGATHYVVELDRFTTFDWMPLKRVVTTNSAFIGNFCTPNVDEYFWRVRPFNEYSTCESSFGEVSTFSTNAIASKVETVEGVNYWNVRPNPANSSSAVFVDIEALNTMDASVNMYNMTGQLISSSTALFSTGINTIELATTNLTAGLYMVSIETKTGVTTKRLVIR